MNHKDILKLLFPADLAETFEDDITLEGAALDAAAAGADTLLANVFADTSILLLADWERILGLTPEAGADTATRQTACVAKLREKGGLSRAYFIQLALEYGYTIEINEFRPFMTGIGRMGDRLYEEAIIFCWEVAVTAIGEPGISNQALEALFRDIKPADTRVIFTWPVINHFRRTCMPGALHPHICDARTWDSRIPFGPIEPV